MLDAVIIGGGPAGMGVISALFRALQHRPNPHARFHLIDAKPLDDTGELANYHIPSDTRAEKFLTCLDDLPREITLETQLSDLTRRLKAYGPKAAPLPLVGEFYRVLGQNICRAMQATGQLSVSAQTKAARANWTGACWDIECCKNEVINHLHTKNLVLAGGAPEVGERFERFLSGYDLTSDDLNAQCLSSELLKMGIAEGPLQRITKTDTPKVTIIGGSHSAISSAAKCLTSELNFQKHAIQILHRSPMYVTFDSAAAAHDCGFTDFGPDDICPNTHRVYALKGFRLDSRDLLMSIQGYSEGLSEDRVKLRATPDMSPQEVKSALLEADLVISALGYSPNFIPLYTAGSDHPIQLNAPNFVDGNSALLDNNARPIPHCYALGLAANYDLSGKFGEPSFQGQANGLVLWHKDIGMDIASRLLGGL